MHKFNGSKFSFSDASTAETFWTSTKVIHNSITTEVILEQLKSQASPDVIFVSCSVKIPSENVVAFFRQLLVWNYLQTDVAHFSIMEPQGIVALVLRRRFENFDYLEFKDIIEKMSVVNMNCLALLKRSFSV